MENEKMTAIIRSEVATFKADSTHGAFDRLCRNLYSAGYAAANEWVRCEDRLAEAESIVDRLLDEGAWVVDACEIDRDAKHQLTSIVDEARDYRTKYPNSKEVEGKGK